VWFKIASANSSHSQILSTQGIFPAASGWRLILGSANHANFQYWNQFGSVRIVSYGTALNLNEWYHVVAVKDAGNIHLYINGDLKNSTSATDNISYQSGIYLNASRWFGGPGYHFNGYTDEVRIYNRALSESEIQSIYNATK